MNRSYKKPLVQAERGGTKGGGAHLTSYGRHVLACYREMEQKSLTAMEEPWKKIRRMLKKFPGFAMKTFGSRELIRPFF